VYCGWGLGCWLGFVLALVCYRYYYPPLGDGLSHLPTGVAEASREALADLERGPAFGQRSKSPRAAETIA
jgi:hypothetical protein